jgi:hypothetical protein
MPAVGVKAGPKQKTIEVRLRFWTDGLAGREGNILPAVCWDSGKAFVIANSAHGIGAGAQVDFKDLAGIPRAVAKSLDSAGVTVRKSK